MENGEPVAHFPRKRRSTTTLYHAAIPGRKGRKDRRAKGATETPAWFKGAAAAATRLPVSAPHVDPSFSPRRAASVQPDNRTRALPRTQTSSGGRRDEKNMAERRWRKVKISASASFFLRCPLAWAALYINWRQCFGTAKTSLAPVHSSPKGSDQKRRTAFSFACRFSLSLLPSVAVFLLSSRPFVAQRTQLRGVERARLQDGVVGELCKVQDGAHALLVVQRRP